jgi:hypothetical protein
MADVTYPDFQERVARKLQLLADGQDLPANYAAIIIDAAKSVNAQVSAAGLAFDIENGINHEYVNSFAELCAAECADDFEIAEPRRSMLRANGWGLPGRSPAERSLRRYFTTAKLITDVDVYKE